MSLNEFIVKAAVLTWFGELDYTIGRSPHLATLRDTLLPKLLSGELSMATAAKRVEARA